MSTRSCPDPGDLDHGSIRSHAMETLRARDLVGWFGEHGRDLPWRHTRDPWAVLVSEFMLTQTQVSRVVVPFGRFLEQFPTVIDCAEASTGSVIEAWVGLGYNRRAVNLHRSAQIVVAAHGGVVPRDLVGLLTLPGVGPYVARAVLVFAFGDDVGVVDTNVARVLARWHGRPLGRREVQTLADAAVPPGEGWVWNQALFDLGATICTARNPTCATCPVLPWCTWRGQGVDPSIGTSGTGSRQSRFAGSDRQGRGRLVDALRVGPVSAEPGSLASVMGWPNDPARAVRVAAALVTDGLAVQRDGRFELP